MDWAARDLETAASQSSGEGGGVLSTGTTSPSAGSTTRQAASTVDWAANSQRSPVSAAPISRS
jgi:hypothetical protein